MYSTVPLGGTLEPSQWQSIISLSPTAYRAMDSYFLAATALVLREPDMRLLLQ